MLACKRAGLRCGQKIIWKNPFGAKELKYAAKYYDNVSVYNRNYFARQWEGSTLRSEVKEVALMLKNVQNSSNSLCGR